MKPIERIFTANETQSIAAVGNFVYLKNATTAILIKSDSGESMPLEVGEFVKFDKPFTNLSVTNLSAVSNTVELHIGSGTAGKYPGTVDAIPFDDTKNGNAFFGGQSLTTGATFNKIASVNPAGSGVTAKISRMQFSFAGTGPFFIVTDTAVNIAAGGLTISPNGFGNKNPSLPAPSLEKHFQAGGVVYGTGTKVYKHDTLVAGSEDKIDICNEYGKIHLPAGYGIVAYGNTAGDSVMMDAEFIEV